MKLDFIRVLNAMYEKGFFKDEQQNKISKKEVLKHLVNASIWIFLNFKTTCRVL